MEVNTIITSSKDQIRRVWHINVSSPILQKYPKCMAPLGIKVQSYYEPKTRTNLNDWFTKKF